MDEDAFYQRTDLPEWPFDADRRHPLAARRVPVVPDVHPEWRYEVALCIGGVWEGQEPTDAEADMLVAYIEYRQQWYNATWRARHRTKPLDVDAGTNTVVLIKYPHGGWAHRRVSWSTGPPLVPFRKDDPVTLATLLDRINSIGDTPSQDWVAWKAAHPEVFGPEAAPRATE